MKNINIIPVILLLSCLSACTGPILREKTATGETIAVTPTGSARTSAAEIQQTGTSITVPSTRTPAHLPTISTTASPQATPQNTINASSVFWIKQIHLFNGGAGWAIVQTQAMPNSSKLYKITNGGEQWNNVTGTLPAGSSPNLAFIHDEQSLLVMSVKSDLSDVLKMDITPYQTFDGGKNWSEGEPIAIPEGMIFVPGEVTFVDREHGWLIGKVTIGHSYETGYQIFETQDGGLHWQLVYDPYEQRVVFANPSVIWAPWVYPFQTGELKFTSQMRGYLISRKLDELSLALSTTNDGGKTWAVNFIPIPDSVSIPKDICCRQYISLPQFFSENSGVLLQQLLRNDAPGNYFDKPVYSVPEATYLQFTQDGGATWRPQLAPAKMGGVFFLSQQIGWYLGKDSADPKVPAQMYQTIDSGKTWRMLANSAPLPLGSVIHFMDEKNGYATHRYGATIEYQAFNETTAQNSLFFLTSDSGQTWVKVDPVWDMVDYKEDMQKMIQVVINP